MIAKTYRWELTAVALAALLSMGGSNALALSLGRVTVQSALGEPLAAEIDIPQINADEAASLKVQVAPPATFRSAGLEFSPVMTDVRMLLQYRPDGRTYLRLSSDRLIQEPYVDLILDASWQTGRIVRNYTMLFDPPGLRPKVAVRPPPVVQAEPAVALPSRSAPVPAAPPRPVVRQSPVAAETKSAAATLQGNVQRVTVRPGESASKIAMTHIFPSISLDQMLVAMLQANPGAFIEGNINRLKAGATLVLPTEQQAGVMPAAQASQMIVAQSQDFDQYRRALAGNLTSAKQAPAERSVSGTIQARVDDQKSAAATPDKLTLSKATVQNATDLAQLALAQSAKESASRAAQMRQNTADINQLADAAAALAASGATSAAAAVIAPGTPASGASAPQTVVPMPAVTVPAKPPLAAPVPATASGFLDELLANPLVPVAAAGLVVLLGGLGFYKLRQRRKNAQPTQSFLENQERPESLFGSNGGENVDTLVDQGGRSSMLFSASQLDAVEAVDPLVEADVYLAYGRDIQAEEILKDALRAQPERLAIHQKLLAIYAKRQDTKAYAAVAAVAFPLTQGKGIQWEQICESGLALDPGNSLYLAGGQPSAVAPPPDTVSFSNVPIMGVAAAAPHALPGTGDGNAVDLDLDLDFSLDESAPAAPTASAVSIEPVPVPVAVKPGGPLGDLSGMTLDFAPQPSDPPALSEPATEVKLESLPTLEGLDFAEESAEPEPPESRVVAAEKPSGMLEFDFSALSLELEDLEPAPIDPVAALAPDALESKLVLADEFKASGDLEGANELIQQVINEADGDLKARAQQALSQS
ncbi:FimV/HubP family polar landmark protein [Rhodoferax sp.]|uniref:FimV/HubP family polar landmark protein n=1 Tax=Rhodoferax sp. TaxID=50421 RepID=UPI000A9784C9|nr:FimV/HubP family polar landmark protein [Rhodoferax sp.]MDO8319829.1 FimV/HubP family polar landmark protein [Rhodoferax sp.]